MLSRRHFLLTTGAAILSSRIASGMKEIPSSLDHVILGCNELDRGIAFVQERVGIRAVVGGTHPDRGTANAVVSLGNRHYLEIMAPDPKASDVKPWAAQQLSALKGLTTPRLITWAVHHTDIDGLANKFRGSGIAILGPWPGSRTKPDGTVVSWKSFSLADDHHGLLPFFIEWSANSVHPSSEAPAGCRIEQFGAADQDPNELSKTFQRIDVSGVSIESGERQELRLEIVGPKGRLDVTS
jgi:hypothetical protein